MPKNACLTESAEWIDLGIVERERTPREIIEKVFPTNWLNYQRTEPFIHGCFRLCDSDRTRISHRTS